MRSVYLVGKAFVRWVFQVGQDKQLKFRRSIFSSRSGRRLAAGSFAITAALGLSTAPAQAECTDTDGDGWGWDGSNTCTDLPPTVTAAGESADPDVRAASGNSGPFSVVPDQPVVPVESEDPFNADTGATEPQLDTEPASQQYPSGLVLAQLEPESETSGDGVAAESASGSPSGSEGSSDQQIDGSVDGSDESPGSEIDSSTGSDSASGQTGDGSTSSTSPAVEEVSETMQTRYDDGYALIGEAREALDANRFELAHDLLDQADNLRMPVQGAAHAVIDRQFATQLFGTRGLAEHAQRIAEAPVVFGTTEDRVALANATILEGEQLFQAGNFEQAEQAVDRAAEILAQIEDDAPRQEASERFVDLAYSLSDVGLGPAVGEPTVTTRPAAEMYLEAIDALEVAEAVFESGELDHAVFFMQEATESMSSVVDPADEELRKQYRDKVFDLAARINMARYEQDRSRPISPDETNKAASQIIDALAADVEYSGSLIIRGPGDREIEVNIIEGVVTEATIANLPISEAEMVSLMLALANQKALPQAKLATPVLSGETAIQAAADWTYGDLRGEFFGTPTELPEDSRSRKPLVGGETAIQAAVDWTDGDLRGEFFGSPTENPDLATVVKRVFDGGTAKRAAADWFDGDLRGEFFGTPTQLPDVSGDGVTLPPGSRLNGATANLLGVPRSRLIESTSDLDFTTSIDADIWELPDGNVGLFDDSGSDKKLSAVKVPAVENSQANNLKTENPQANNSHADSQVSDWSFGLSEYTPSTDLSFSPTLTDHDSAQSPSAEGNTYDLPATRFSTISLAFGSSDDSVPTSIDRTSGSSISRPEESGSGDSDSDNIGSYSQASGFGGVGSVRSGSDVSGSQSATSTTGSSDGGSGGWEDDWDDDIDWDAGWY